MSTAIQSSIDLWPDISNYVYCYLFTQNEWKKNGFFLEGSETFEKIDN